MPPGVTAFEEGLEALLPLETEASPASSSSNGRDALMQENHALQKLSASGQEDRCLFATCTFVDGNVGIGGGVDVSCKSSPSALTVSLGHYTKFSPHCSFTNTWQWMGEGGGCLKSA